MALCRRSTECVTVGRPDVGTCPGPWSTRRGPRARLTRPGSEVGLQERVLAVGEPAGTAPLDVVGDDERRGAYVDVVVVANLVRQAERGGAQFGHPGLDAYRIR